MARSAQGRRPAALIGGVGSQRVRPCLVGDMAHDTPDGDLWRFDLWLRGAEGAGRKDGEVSRGRILTRRRPRISSLFFSKKVA